jgi:glycosylphosphatidylinositol transamidase (GPIT) subunit GPI8
MILFYSWRLRFGDIDLSSSLDDEDLVQELNITKITKHPNYKQGVAYFDVAVLEVDPVEFTGNVRPVCLPTSKDFKVDRYEPVTLVYYLFFSQFSFKFNLKLFLFFGRWICIKQ